MESGIHNTSEIGRLRKVMLHRPGGELENLMPEYLERLLFDDIPYLREAQREHDSFAACLRSQGVEVVYLTDLVVQSLTDGQVRDELIRQFLEELSAAASTQTNSIIDLKAPMYRLNINIAAKTGNGGFQSDSYTLYVNMLSETAPDFLLKNDTW